MIAIFLNKYQENEESDALYDLEFDEENTQMLRLSGVSFNPNYNQQDMIDRANEIFIGNFSEQYELTEIITQ